MKTSELLQDLYGLTKRLEDIRLFRQDMPFNNTQMQLLGEILRADEAGQRIISSRLAKLLGITRSAVSQIVNKLEEKKIVRRVSDEHDRKIAYIELTPEAQKLYEQMCVRADLILGRVVAQLGEDKVAGFIAGANEFIDAFHAAADDVEASAVAAEKLS